MWVSYVIIAVVIGFLVYLVVKVVTAISDKKAEIKEFAKLKEAAEKGSAEDQFKLGDYYLYHNKVSEAESWYNKASELGYSAAQSRLRICAVAYTTKYKTEKGYGFDFWELEAEKGDASAQYLVGSMYQTCFEVDSSVKKIQVFDIKDMDLVKAAYWFKKAAEQGYPLGQCDLGECYLFGQGVEKNEKLGYSLLLKAAENNESEAARKSARSTIEKTSGMSYKEFVLKHT